MPASLCGRIEPLIPKPNVAGSGPVVRFPGLAVSRTFSPQIGAIRSLGRSSRGHARTRSHALAGESWSHLGRIRCGGPRTEAARLQAAPTGCGPAVAGSKPVAHLHEF